MDINSTMKSSYPVWGSETFSADIVLAAATVTPLYAAIQSAVPSLWRSPKQIWIMGALGSTDVLVGTATPTFPVPHVPAGSHPEPMKLIVDPDGAGPSLVSAAGGTVHCLVWQD